ncbi:uncharacterized protein FA14DRAFT_52787 [Meira miltonrushii]|uniref:Uncharacterized protein n=1 Tax=Meira miltonrushii TaxID=1280837 RepID=A0A316VKZ5_9BASI|nr:uncharacterized protein FA14DRAFT_52787 [Meira miltonrushii]PWN36205.1 hypothetical protein FA14DRAFT_52787 [Meira miltonrushii]
MNDQDRLIGSYHVPFPGIMQLIRCIIVLLLHAYFVNRMHSTSTDHAAEEVPPHHEIDLELRLGPSMPAVEPSSTQSLISQPNPAPAIHGTGVKRKRKGEQPTPNDIRKKRKDKNSARSQRRREKARLNAIKRRKEIREKGPEAIKAEQAIQKAYQKNYLANLGKDPTRMELYKAKKRENAKKRYKRLVTNEITGEDYRHRLNELKKKKNRLLREEAVKKSLDSIP